MIEFLKKAFAPDDIAYFRFMLLVICMAVVSCTIVGMLYGLI